MNKLKTKELLKLIIILVPLYIITCWVLPLTFINDYTSEVIGTHIGVFIASCSGFLIGKRL